MCRKCINHKSIQYSMQDFFDNIYVLNLDRRPDRWFGARQQLESMHLTKAIRFPAIDKTPGWVGCFESHLAILQKALNDGVCNLLILEDDARLYSDWASIWQTAKKQIDAEWDMLYLGYNLNPSSNIPPPFASSRLLRLNDALTTHAYAVNKGYLPKLIECVKSTGASIPIDVVYAKQLIQIKAYGVYPMIFYQDAGVSDILGCECHFDFRQNVDQVLNKSG
jgi:glycosyl transferase, family 25